MIDEDSILGTNRQARKKKKKHNYSRPAKERPKGEAERSNEDGCYELREDAEKGLG